MNWRYRDLPVSSKAVYDALLLEHMIQPVLRLVARENLFHTVAAFQPGREKV